MIPSAAPETIPDDDFEAALRACRPSVSPGAERRLGLGNVLRAIGAAKPDALWLGRFRVAEKLGEGAMGIVYRAHDPELDRAVAIKVLRGAPDLDERERVRDEARALARLASPHVVAVHDVETTGDDVFLTMEHVQGKSLAEWLGSHRGASWREVLGVFLQAARGLADAHRAGIVHRDFKPENVLVGDDGRARVVDFGLARPARALEGGIVAGTPHFLAPELGAGGAATFASDQYAFAVALGDALDPERQPDGWNAGPPGLHAYIGRGLHRDPSRRWPSMDALIEALEQTTHPRSDDRLRLLLVERVERLWLSGVLQRDLGGRAPVPLTIADVPGAVLPPWSEWTALPHSTRLGTIGHLSGLLDRAHGSMLVLGAPGSGKTTALLALARELLGIAKSEPGASAPVVLNLSSLRPEHFSVAEWIEDEILTKYSLPRTATRRWMAENALVLLLDGLDEIPPDRRRACVEALNQLRSEHAVPVVVTCRDEEYHAIGEKLRFGAAIRVMPPDDAAIEAIVARRDGGSLIERLREDTHLRERVRNPLLLTLLARDDGGDAAPPPAGDRDIYDDYVDRAFDDLSPERRTRSLEALAWLASAMRRRGVSDLWIERLDPSWLEERSEQIGARALGVGLIVGLQAAIALAVGLGLHRPTGFVAVLAGGPIVGVALSTRGYRVVPTEALRWSWLRALKNLPLNMTFGVLVGLVVGSFGDPSVAMKNLVFVGAVLALMAALEPGERETRVRPNEGIRRSLFYAVLVTLCSAPPAAGIAAVALLPEAYFRASDLGAWAYPRLAFWVYGMTFGVLIVFMLYGGATVLAHVAVRWVLALCTPLPLTLVPFLDDCAERGILRRVGGGYMFLHRTMLDHLANRWDEGNARGG